MGNFYQIWLLTSEKIFKGKTDAMMGGFTMNAAPYFDQVN